MDCSSPGSSDHGDSSGKNTGVGFHALLQGYSQLRDRTQVSRIAGWFFTIRAPKEVQTFKYNKYLLIIIKWQALS